jgi:hypothetical protein
VAWLSSSRREDILTMPDYQNVWRREQRLLFQTGGGGVQDGGISQPEETGSGFTNKSIRQPIPVDMKQQSLFGRVMCRQNQTGHSHPDNAPWVSKPNVRF